MDRKTIHTKTEVTAYELDEDNKKFLLNCISITRYNIKAYCALHQYEDKQSLSKKDFERLIIEKAFLPINDTINRELKIVTDKLMAKHNLTKAAVDEEIKNGGNEK